MKYKRGEVSRILNIPVDTLRFYEQKNIINPSKDEENNYRLYDAWDINFLLDYRKFRSYDFSLAEIESILHRGSLEDFIDKIDERQQYIEKKLEYYALLRKKNLDYIRALKSIEKNLDKCTLVEQPEKYYFIHRHNSSFEYVERIGEVAKVWLEHLPFVDFMIELSLETVIDRKNRNDYRWGFSVQKEYALAFDLPISDKVNIVSHKKCIYTVICIRDKNVFTLELLDYAMDYIKRNNFKLCGNITGNLLSRVHESEGYFRYIELWLPVE